MKTQMDDKTNRYTNLLPQNTSVPFSFSSEQEKRFRIIRGRQAHGIKKKKELD